MLPVPGNLLDVVIDEIPEINKLLVARFRVLKYNESRGMYVIQLVETRQEDKAHGNSKKP